MPLESEQTLDDLKNSVKEKSKNAFRTISEVAKELGLPQHVLRFWETKFPQVSPMKRGGGRRYYRPEDVAVLKSIRSLLHDEGYTIKGVQKLLKKSGSLLLVEEQQKQSLTGNDTMVELAEENNPTPTDISDEKTHNKGVFSGLARHEAKKLLDGLVAVRENLKKYS